MDVDIEPLEPKPKERKFLYEPEYISVILIQDNRIIQNNLFIEEDLAENNFINLVCEYSYNAISKKEAAAKIEEKICLIPNGSITIGHPNVNIR